MKFKISNIIKNVLCWVLLFNTILFSINSVNHCSGSVEICNKKDAGSNIFKTVYNLITSRFVHQKNGVDSNEADSECCVEKVELYYAECTTSNIIFIEYDFEHKHFYPTVFLPHFPELNTPPPKTTA